jgi:indolepyruvate ferredoxin oxidoreductase beta subunit
VSAALAPPARLAVERPISLALLAMGGQGGGVVSDWLIALGEGQGWVVQATSVPGVAQRTGATIYYVEMTPAREGRQPVLALMPNPGDVDIVVAAEFMEAGRSMMRGLVTPDRTTLITSTHRSFAVVEKEKPGDGIADSGIVVDAADFAAKRIIAFDMQRLAEQNGSVISAALFGALAGAEVLPFPREAFEGAIRAGGKGVEPSLRAFGAAFDRARQQPVPEAESALPAAPALPDTAGHPALDGLLARIRGEFPEAAHPMLYAGTRHLVDFQDVAYADAYLDRMAGLLALDRAQGGEGADFALTREGAKYLAKAMAFDDVIRVADLKTRDSRFDRVRREVGVKANELLYTTEFMHPRMEEVAGTLPAGLGRFIENRPGLMGALDRVVNRGRRVRTGTIGWFAALYALGGMKRFRRGTLRYAREIDHIERWLALVAATAPGDYALAVETLACRRLVKGYSDTHARGTSKFDRVTAMVPFLAGKPDGAAWLRRLKEAALADEEGLALNGALMTVRSAYD